MKVSSSKYHNKPTIVDDHRFPSRKEAHRYQDLKLLLKAKRITDLKLQPRFELQPAFEKNGIKYRAIHYIADFAYWDIEKGQRIIEDTKGFRKDKVFLLKKKFWEYKYPKSKLLLT